MVFVSKMSLPAKVKRFRKTTEDKKNDWWRRKHCFEGNGVREERNNGKTKCERRRRRGVSSVLRYVSYYFVNISYMKNVWSGKHENMCIRALIVQSIFKSISVYRDLLAFPFGNDWFFSFFWIYHFFPITIYAGRAFLFKRVVNLTFTPIQDRVMLTGRHMVRDVYCKNCKTKLGWMYEYATEESQKYVHWSRVYKSK